MQITKEPYQKEHWTAALRALSLKDQCLVADRSHYYTLRTTATRLQQKNGTKYSFQRTGAVVKVWRVA